METKGHVYALPAIRFRTYRVYQGGEGLPCWHLIVLSYLILRLVEGRTAMRYGALYSSGILGFVSFCWASRSTAQIRLMHLGWRRDHEEGRHGLGGSQFRRPANGL